VTTKTLMMDTTEVGGRWSAAGEDSEWSAAPTGTCGCRGHTRTCSGVFRRQLSWFAKKLVVRLMMSHLQVEIGTLSAYMSAVLAAHREVLLSLSLRPGGRSAGGEARSALLTMLWHRAVKCVT